MLSRSFQIANVKLEKEVLIYIYQSLIRSVMEYTAIVAPRLTETGLTQLQRIQNHAIRIIYRLPRDTPISDLHETAKLKMLEDRFRDLKMKYVNKAITSNNPLIVNAYED